MKKKIINLIWASLLIVSFGLGYNVGKDSIPSIEQVSGLINKESAETVADFSLFWDAWRVIEEKYIDRGKLDTQKMVYGAIDGLMGSLGDPYSVYMPPEESKKFIDDMSGSFGGIGAEIGIRKETLTVVSPLEGSPAQKAGLKAGDKILKINDTLTADLTVDQALAMIRGDAGTEVALLIARDEWEQTKEMKIVRDTIKIPILKWEFKDDQIAYIQIYNFTENLSREFEQIVVDEIMPKNPKGIVLDLRNNPGGYLETAVDIASWFLTKGELVVTENYSEEDKDKNDEFRSRGYKILENIPTVVLINEGSASASEILAGALRDIRKIQLVGKTTFGKGSVQQLEKLKDKSSIKLTVAKWLTPSGVSISDEGIKPDYEVELTEKDIEEFKDPQLDKALELLK